MKDMKILEVSRVTLLAWTKLYLLLMDLYYWNQKGLFLNRVWSWFNYVVIIKESAKVKSKLFYWVLTLLFIIIPDFGVNQDKKWVNMVTPRMEAYL